MLNFFIFAIAILIYIVASEHWLRKKFAITKPKGFFIYQGVNKTHKWIERAMLAAFLILMFIVSYNFLVSPFPLVFTFLLSLSSFRAFMEWKYEKEKKQYILTINSVFVYMFILVFYLLNPI